MPGVKTAAFTKRLVTFNETFAPLRKFSKTKGIVPTGIIWHEGISGQNTEDVATTFAKVIRSAQYGDIKHFIFLCDNYLGQNKIGSFSPCSAICWMSMAVQSQLPSNILKKVTHSWVLSHSTTKLKKKWVQRKNFATSTIFGKTSNQNAVSYPWQKEISIIAKMGSVKGSLHYSSLYYAMVKLLCSRNQKLKCSGRRFGSKKSSNHVSF